MNKKYKSRNDDNGIYARICPMCENNFRTNNKRTIYCTEACGHIARHKHNKKENYLKWRQLIGEPID